MGGIHGEHRPLHHLAKSQMDVEGSVIKRSSQSRFARHKVVRRMVLRHHRSGPCALLTTAAAILHASFHQARPLVPWDPFFAKNLSQVVCVSVSRSVLALISKGTSEISGRGKVVKACFHSCSIWSSIIHPVWDGGVGGGVSKGRSTNSMAWSKEIDFSKDTKQVARKKGLSRKAMLTKM